MATTSIKGLHGKEYPTGNGVVRPISSAPSAKPVERAYDAAINANVAKRPLPWTKRAKRIGEVLAGATVAAAVVGAILVGREVTKDEPPVIDQEGSHRVYEIGKGDTLWDVVNEAYPLPNNYKSMSEHEQAEAQEAVNDRRAEVREADKEILANQGKTVGELHPGDELLLPADAAVGQLIDPSQQRGEPLQNNQVS